MGPENVIRLTGDEGEFLTSMAGAGRMLFTIQDAHAYWKDPERARQVLHALAARGWLERLQRGTYMIIPLEAGPERIWTESPLAVAMHLVTPAAIAYWTALHHWHLTEQLPRITYVQTTARTRPQRREILGTTYQFVTVVPRKFFGDRREYAGHHPFRVTDPEKTLLDCLDRPDLGGGIVQVAAALRAAPNLEWDRVDAYLDAMATGTVAKRLGFLVERGDLPVPGRQSRLERWKRSISRGISKLDPSGGATPHRIDTVWGLAINEDESALLEGAP